jgi:hypothetical protein
MFDINDMKWIEEQAKLEDAAEQAKIDKAAKVWDKVMVQNDKETEDSKAPPGATDSDFKERGNQNGPTA